MKNSSITSENDHALYVFTTGGTIDLTNSEIDGNGTNGDYYFNAPKAGYYSKIIIDGVTVYEKIG